ncbi:hypothetical protein PK28_02285 [Hymenobacter sp. DG25B]|nr:hypothetical protein PK28_02285 [Hymenobacter sp. DG25B]
MLDIDILDLKDENERAFIMQELEKRINIIRLFDPEDVTKMDEDMFLELLGVEDMLYSNHIPYHFYYHEWLPEMIEKYSAIEVSEVIYNEIERFRIFLKEFYQVDFDKNDLGYLLSIFEIRLRVLDAESIDSPLFNTVNYDGILKADRVVVLQTAISFLDKYKIEYFEQPVIKQVKITHPNGKAWTHKQISLLHHYQGKHEIISIKSAEKVAEPYGLKSGERLYKFYLKFNKEINIINVDGGQIKPMLKDIHAILPSLSDKQKKQAEEDADKLRKTQRLVRD